ncbi:MAG: universal stress protein [Candidatus Hydrothermarchaeales archaeon]
MDGDMTGDEIPSFLNKVLLPVADPEDARETCQLAIPIIKNRNAKAVALFIVLTKKPTISQQELIAKETLSIMEEEFKRNGIPLISKTNYSRDVVKAMIEEGEKGNVDAIVIRPRIASRLTKFLAGDVLEGLVEKTKIPIIILPQDI